MPEPRVRALHEKDRSCWRDGCEGIERGIAEDVCAQSRRKARDRKGERAKDRRSLNVCESTLMLACLS